ncbi:MAG: methyl-accepting chemotaxis protein [Pseudomonadota bacterium]
MVMQPPTSLRTTSAPADPLKVWLPLLTSSLETLRRLAGTTEREFLQIGARMQEIHQQTFDLSGTSQQLVEVASGERLHSLIHRLREILFEMDNYLGQAQNRSETSRTTLNVVGNLLKEVGAPLLGIRRMCKHLYTLEVLIKIESAHIGEKGSEFINLAIDIKKLSQQIKEKIYAIEELRLLLAASISKNNIHIESAKVEQDSKAEKTRTNTAKSLRELEEINDRFSRLGSLIAATSEENSGNISTIVQSMQFHDIYRQQVEHVIEAIEGLLPAFTALQSSATPADDKSYQDLIGKVGDVCELQQEQLRFASSELYQAVVAIVGNLQSIGIKQKEMAKDIFEHTGTIDASDTSFIDDVSRQMTSLTSLLTSCTDSNNEVTGIMRDVTGAVSKITGFVSDIENIGRDIIQIALNARIKAASTGEEGASLSVLAEEIGQLSNEAVDRTDLISTTLAEVDSTTKELSSEVNNGEANLAGQLISMKEELNGILAVLNEMGDELLALLKQVKNQVTCLTEEIETLTGGIDVHEHTKSLADAVLAHLGNIFSEARKLHPASAEFKADLRLMAQRYTMESERRIHESIASKHGVGPTKAKIKTIEKPVIETEFGDNVDLF